MVNECRDDIFNFLKRVMLRLARCLRLPENLTIVPWVAFNRTKVDRVSEEARGQIFDVLHCAARVFLREAELNPHPVFEAPWLFFFMSTALQLGLVVFAALGVASKAESDRRRDLAWILILLVLISTST